MWYLSGSSHGQVTNADERRRSSSRRDDRLEIEFWVELIGSAGGVG